MLFKSVRDFTECLKAEAKKELAKYHYFSVSVILNAQSIAAFVNSNDAYNPHSVSLACLEIGMTKEYAMKTIANSIAGIDPRAIVEKKSSTDYSVHFSDEALLKVYKDHYLKISEKRIYDICRSGIFVDEQNGIPYKITVLKEGIKCQYADISDAYYSVAFNLLERPKTMEATIAICGIINQFSKMKYTQEGNILYRK